ncbi:MAG: sigma-54-dependent Fis family transcriptional regulator [Candidatus Omnitrophica bacterium]|nr:sigma-54-dependent Fis family transcriptional regulator [Candidatus Omnitrophota bacterium]
MLEIIKILIADDNQSELEALSKILSRAGYQVFETKNGQEALELLKKQAVDLLITDLQMPGLSGQDLLKLAKTLKPDIEIIVITGHGSVEQAVDAIKAGAYDFIEKPIRKVGILKAVDKALEKQKLTRENIKLSRLLEEYQSSDSLIGKSPNFNQAVGLAGQVAASEATVLIQGESGTGKELFANLIQRKSPRREGPFIKLNCAAIPETLLEAELFGHEKGAFTGALAMRQGRFELAHTGTLFLDEVGDMSPALQAKFLRVLEGGEFERVGGAKTLKVDVRIIAATNANLEAKVKEKTFREDLYYRLNVVRIIIPPLRERRSDTGLLSAYFLQKYNQKNKKAIKGFKPETLAILENFLWPGNVRELENVVERAVVLCKGEEVAPGDLPPEIAQSSQKSGFVTFAIGTPLAEIEEKMIEEALKYAGGDKDQAAKLLGTSSRTIYRKIQP